jgi:hypothetical protein
MERIVERPGALDVHKESVTACVRVWEGRRLVEHMADFRTTVQGLLGLRDWLQALGARQVAMEATGVYWKPVWAVLEDQFECILVNARHIKAVPGRGCPRSRRSLSGGPPASSAPVGSVRGVNKSARTGGIRHEETYPVRRS